MAFSAFKAVVLEELVEAGAKAMAEAAKEATRQAEKVFMVLCLLGIQDEFACALLAGVQDAAQPTKAKRSCGAYLSSRRPQQRHVTVLQLEHWF